MTKTSTLSNAETSSSRLRLNSTRTVLVVVTLLLLKSTALLTYTLDSSFSMLITVGVVWTATVWLIIRGLDDHPYKVFGIANTVTAARAGGVALLAGTIPLASLLGETQNATGSSIMWGMCAFVAVLLLLDGVDGYFARKAQLSSTFGARFDMEVDAFLALVIATFLWQSDKLGIWVLGLGIMRYVFVVASVWSKPLQAPLFPSLRRKTVCVIQIAALCIMLSPLFDTAQATVIGSIALLLLAASFLRDVLWLYRQPPVVDQSLPLISCINKAAGSAASNEIRP